MADDASRLLSRILSGSSVVFAGSLIHKLIAFVSSIFIAQLLGDAGYGVVVVALSVFFIFSDLLSLGLNSGVARNYPQAKTDRHRRGILVSSFQIALITATVGSTAVFLSAELLATRVFDDPSLTPVLRIIAVLIPLKIVFTLSIGGLQGIKKATIKTLLTSILQPILRIALIVAFVLAGLGAVGVATAYTISTGVVMLLALLFLHRYTDLFAFGQPIRRVHRSLLVFSIPLVGSSVILKLMNNVDTLLIGALTTSGDVGQYNVAFVLGQSALLFHQSLGFMFMPEMSQLYGDDRLDRADMIYRAMTKWTAFASVPFIMTALAYPEYVITFIYSQEYQQATIPFVVLMLGFLTHIIVGQNKSTLVAFGDTKTMFRYDFASLAANLILNLSLIPTFGIVGAAVATAGTYVVRNAALSWILYRSYGLQPFSRWYALPLVPTVGTAAVLRIVFSDPTLLVVIGYAATVSLATVVGYLSRGVEEADLMLADIFEKNLGIDLDFVRQIHDVLRK